MTKLIFCLFSILTFTTTYSFGQNNEIVLKNHHDETLAAGQLWQYHTRKGEKDSRVLILKTEQAENGEIIVHISITNLKRKDLVSGEVSTTGVGHLPFSKSVLVESLTTLESSDNQLPDFNEGYNEWRKAFVSGKGGYFTISLKEVVEYLLKE